MSSWFKFTYHPYVGEDLKTGELVEVYRPTVPIAISYKGNLSRLFQSLVDSGSDRNLFPASLGESIGIDIKSGDKRPIQGIGKHDIVAYTHKIKIYIERFDFATEVDFSFEHQAPILGRDGFFKFFKKVISREKEKSIEFRI